MGKKRNATVTPTPTTVPTPAVATTSGKAQQSSQGTYDKRRFVKVYREYSRTKYMKYKYQFPRLRESQIVQKILKEWDALSAEDKIKLQKQYVQMGGVNLQNLSSKSKSKSKSKSGSDSVIKRDVAKQEQIKQEQQKPEEKPKKKKKPSPKVRVFIQKATNRNINFMDDSGFKKQPVQKYQSDNQSLQVVVQGKKQVKKTKKIKKTTQEQEKIEKGKKKQSQYLQFYKYYYNRLQAEHPRWSSSQIGSIIKLLWRKRTNSAKKSRVLPTNLNKKPVSGRVLYRKQKQSAGLNKEQIDTQWRALPFECKKKWEIKARGKTLITKPLQKSIQKLKRIMNKGSDGSQKLNSLKWMNSQISNA